ncbi:hypothetical protein DRQ36_00695 [bacterium]|nr:MAG: hypothetical protein DRQ36_00695 [bacterium]
MPVLKAVYDERLTEFLEKLGLLSQILGGSIRCHQCGKVITIKNFGSVKRLNGDLVVFCNTPECIANSLKEPEIITDSPKKTD